MFACSEIAEPQYLRHVETVAADCAVINFSCRYAMLSADDHDDMAYVFLVPDEGYSQLSRLHDRLYTGVLSSYLRLDIPFIPHITIGTLKDRQEAKKLCDDLNEQPLSLHGSVNALTVGALVEGRISDVQSFSLTLGTR